jgi:hypothetical protein
MIRLIQERKRNPERLLQLLCRSNQAVFKLLN